MAAVLFYDFDNGRLVEVSSEGNFASAVILNDGQQERFFQALEDVTLDSTHKGSEEVEAAKQAFIANFFSIMGVEPTFDAMVDALKDAK